MLFEFGMGNEERIRTIHDATWTRGARAGSTAPARSRCSSRSSVTSERTRACDGWTRSIGRRACATGRPRGRVPHLALTRAGIDDILDAVTRSARSARPHILRRWHRSPTAPDLNERGIQSTSVGRPRAGRTRGQGQGRPQVAPRSSHGCVGGGGRSPDPSRCSRSKPRGAFPTGSHPLRPDAESPFAFFRGGALIMASDLAAPPHRVHRAALRRRAPVELRHVRFPRAPPAVRHQRLRRDAPRTVGVGRQASGREPRGPAAGTWRSRPPTGETSSCGRAGVPGNNAPAPRGWARWRRGTSTSGRRPT